jgi:hypothetical protein
MRASRAAETGLTHERALPHEIREMNHHDMSVSLFDAAIREMSLFTFGFSLLKGLFSVTISDSTQAARRDRHENDIILQLLCILPLFPQHSCSVEEL